jgi:hypothetical protein
MFHVAVRYFPVFVEGAELAERVKGFREVDAGDSVGGRMPFAGELR